MKAILVIEIEHDNFDDIEQRGMTIPTIDLYSKKSGERLKAYSDLILRPLPQSIDIRKIDDAKSKLYAPNTRALIDEILGEE